MTGSGGAALFAADPEAAIVGVLQHADTALSAREIKQRLRDLGVPAAAIDHAWPAVQRSLRARPQVSIEAGHRYRLTGTTEPLSVAAALARLGEAHLSTQRRAALVEFVLAALAGTAQAGRDQADAHPTGRDQAHGGQAGADQDRGDEAAGGERGRRAVELPLVRAIAELAIEVEELTANQASSRAMIHRVRARVKGLGLEPINEPGERTTLDRSRHDPIGRPIDDGTTVVVVRPGYVWKAPTGDVLIVRAVVQDRS